MNVHAVISAVLSSTCCLLLRAYCRCYARAVFVTRAQSSLPARVVFVTSAMFSLGARGLRYARDIFVTRALSLLRARSLCYVRAVFVTWAQSLLRACCLCYVLSLLPSAVFITCVQSSFSLTAWKNIISADRKSYKWSIRTGTMMAEKLSAAFSMYVRSKYLHCHSICS